MENTLKPDMPVTDFSPFLSEGKPNANFSDSIKRVLATRNETKQPQKDIAQETLANLLIELS